MFCWLRSIPTPPALVSHPVICTVSVSAAGAFGLYKREWNRIAVSILWQTPQYGARVHEAILGRAEPSQSEHSVKSVGRCYRGPLRPDLQLLSIMLEPPQKVFLLSACRCRRGRSPPTHRQCTVQKSPRLCRCRCECSIHSRSCTELAHHAANGQRQEHRAH